MYKLKEGVTVMIKDELYIFDYDEDSNCYLLKVNKEDTKTFKGVIYYPANTTMFNHITGKPFEYRVNPSLGMHPQTIQGKSGWYKPELMENFKTTGGIRWVKRNEEDGSYDMHGRETFISFDDSVKMYLDSNVINKHLGLKVTSGAIRGKIRRLYYTKLGGSIKGIREPDEIKYLDSIICRRQNMDVVLCSRNFETFEQWDVVVVIEIENMYEIYVPYKLLSRINF